MIAGECPSPSSRVTNALISSTLTARFTITRQGKRADLSHLSMGKPLFGTPQDASTSHSPSASNMSVEAMTQRARYLMQQKEDVEELMVRATICPL
jgi:hypothetical protein